jgi:hypothetical protein
MTYSSRLLLDTIGIEASIQLTVTSLQNERFARFSESQISLPHMRAATVRFLRCCDIPEFCRCSVFLLLMVRITRWALEYPIRLRALMFRTSMLLKGSEVFTPVLNADLSSYFINDEVNGFQ